MEEYEKPVPRGLQEAQEIAKSAFEPFDRELLRQITLRHLIDSLDRPKLPRILTPEEIEALKQDVRERLSRLENHIFLEDPSLARELGINRD